MKTFYFLCIFLLHISIFSFSQTSTETFETETTSSSTFTDNGVTFNIISQVGTFDIQTNYPGTGWNGTANDSYYIDNSGTGNVNTNASFSVKTTSNLFKVNQFWVFLSANNLNQNVSGTLKITGKLSGTIVFEQTKTSGFATSLGATNGFTLIDMSNINGQNYSNTVIDQLQLTIGGGSFNYMCLDAFTWVKETGMVLATNETNDSSEKLNVYPNPTNGLFFTESKENSVMKIYNYAGILVKKVQIKDGKNPIDISSFPSGTYFININQKTQKIIKK